MIFKNDGIFFEILDIWRDLGIDTAVTDRITGKNENIYFMRIFFYSQRYQGILKIRIFPDRILRLYFRFDTKIFCCKFIDRQRLIKRNDFKFRNRFIVRKE